MKKINNLNMKVVYMILASLVLILVDGLWQPGYWVKAFIKIIMFLLIPVSVFGAFNDFKLKKADKRIVILAISIYVLIVAGYLLTRNIIDFSNITTSLTSGAKVNKDNYLLVFGYIALFNSLLEEFFFRYFCFLTIRKVNRKIAYLFSSCLFAIYHCGIINGWFNIGVYLLMLTGLVIGGLLFDYIDEKSNSITNSYLVHMVTNLAINTVGIILFLK